MPRDEKTLRKLTQPADWWAAFEAAAAKDGLSLSEWVGRCCAAGLPESVRRRLPDRRTRGRPRKAANDAAPEP